MSVPGVDAGTVREMGAVLLGRLLTRPDMAGALTEFLDWAVPTVKSARGPEAAFLVPGDPTCSVHA